MKAIQRRIQHTRAKAFTLIEILIVVVILGILAALVIPQVNTAVAQSKMSSLRMDLQAVRKQIAIYRNEHNSHPTLDDFVDQMTMYTDIDGNTNPTKTDVFKYGPYIKSMPLNPLTGEGEIAGTDPGTSDWFYDADTGDFYANDSDETRTY